MDAKLIFKGGGSFVSLPPQFSFDSEIIYVQWKNTILGYSTKTGKRISELKGIKETIIGFTVHYYNSFECITACSKTGEVITWKTVTHFKIVNENIELREIRTFHAIISESSDEMKALISYKKLDNTISFILYDVFNKSFKSYDLNLTIKTYHLDVSNNNNYFAVAYKNNLNVIQLNNFTRINRKKIQGKTITCLICHKNDNKILTGDNLGRVIVWNNIFSNNMIQTVYHWHTLPVLSICFSNEGSFFYSGGNENVLVKWQLENDSDKMFIPRLSSSIQHITVSSNNFLIALALNNNSIKIVDSNFIDISLIQHFIISEKYNSGILYDYRTKSLIMNSNVGHLQFYSPNDKELLYNVDIIGQNRISDERNCKLNNTQIIKTAISKTGNWLATIEEREDSEYSNEIRLKFWFFNLKNQTFELNTLIEYPHDDHINSILFQPNNNDNDLKCITVGDDKKFKIWQLIDATTIYKEGVAWNCFGFGFYRNLCCQALSLSVDGSLMAIGFGSILTTWLPDTIELKCTLIHSNYKDDINFIEFGRNNQCHLIVTATQSQLSVWNLLKLCINWTVSLNVAVLIASPITTNMAVITNKKKLYVFCPSSSKSKYSNSNLLKNCPNITAVSFIPSKNCNDTNLSWYERTPIYLITSEKELYCIGADEEFLETYENINEKISLFSKLIPQQSQVSLVKSNEPSKHLFRRDEGLKALKKYFEAPIQTMMPLRFTCDTLLSSLVVQKSENTKI